MPMIVHEYRQNNNYDSGIGSIIGVGIVIASVVFLGLSLFTAVVHMLAPAAVKIFTAKILRAELKSFLFLCIEGVIIGVIIGLIIKKLSNGMLYSYKTLISSVVIGGLCSGFAGFTGIHGFIETAIYKTPIQAYSIIAVIISNGGAGGVGNMNVVFLFLLLLLIFVIQHVIIGVLLGVVIGLIFGIILRSSKKDAIKQGIMLGIIIGGICGALLGIFTFIVRNMSDSPKQSNSVVYQQSDVIDNIYRQLEPIKNHIQEQPKNKFRDIPLIREREIIPAVPRPFRLSVPEIPKSISESRSLQEESDPPVAVFEKSIDEAPVRIFSTEIAAERRIYSDINMLQSTAVAEKKHFIAQYSEIVPAPAPTLSRIILPNELEAREEINSSSSLKNAGNLFSRGLIPMNDFERWYQIYLLTIPEGKRVFVGRNKKRLEDRWRELESQGLQPEKYMLSLDTIYRPIIIRPRYELPELRASPITHHEFDFPRFNFREQSINTIPSLDTAATDDSSEQDEFIGVPVVNNENDTDYISE